MIEGITLQDYERAETEIRAQEGRTSFYIHAAVYVLVNILLLVINLVVVPEFLWFFFPMIPLRQRRAVKRCAHLAPADIRYSSEAEILLISTGNRLFVSHL